MKRRPFIRVLGSIAFVAALVPAEASAVAGPHVFAPEVVEKMVGVGPISLFFRIYEGGTPTILLESGGGEDSGEWTTFAPRLAAATGATVVTYDRAGYGKSDLPETPYDLGQETEWLFAALGQLGLDDDLVLGGHSYGGLLLRHEAATHPEAIAGLVFIDPFTVEFVDLLGIDYCNNREGLGKLPKLGADEYMKLDKQNKADLRMAGYPEGNLAAKCDLLRPLAVPKGFPVRVLSSGKPWLNENEMKVWREAHTRFTASIDGAKLIIAAESDHMIHERQPELVIQAFADVIAEAKSGN